MTIPFGRRVGVLAAIALSAFAFNTTESLPIGLLQPMAGDLGVSLPAIGLLVGGYGLAVAVISLPVAHWTRHWPRRWVLAGVLAVLAVASLAPAAVSSYPVLFGSRVLIAAAQALFWAVMGATAAGLFPPRVRGRVLGVLSACGSLAIILGVPAGTWLGQQSGWRTPFAVIGVAALATAVLIVVLLPASRPEENSAAFGSAPSRWGFAVVLATTTLTMTGLFTGYTYVAEYLTGAAGLAPELVGAVLLGYGVAGLAGITVFGALLDRWPRGALLTAACLQAASMIALSAYPRNAPVVVALLGLLGASAGPIFSATQARILRVAPGRTEMGFAANSGAFNVGVAAGALLGGVLLTRYGVRSAFLAGGALAASAVGLLVAEPFARARPAGNGAWGAGPAARGARVRQRVRRGTGGAGDSGE